MWPRNLPKSPGDKPVGDAPWTEGLHSGQTHRRLRPSEGQTPGCCQVLLRCGSVSGNPYPATTHRPPSPRSFQSGSNRPSQPRAVPESPSRISKAPVSHSAPCSYAPLSASSVSCRILRSKSSQPPLSITVHVAPDQIPKGNPATYLRPTPSLFLRPTPNRSAQRATRCPLALSFHVPPVEYAARSIPDRQASTLYRRSSTGPTDDAQPCTIASALSESLTIIFL